MSRRALLTTLAVLVVIGVRAGMGPAEREQKYLPLPPTAAIDSFARQLRVGPPQKHANLTLYPVFADGVTIPDIDLTLDEAMDRGLLEIRELKSAEVNRVLLVSRAKEPIFVMGGEMLTGAKQDRIVGDDLIVPPRAELPIPVFCVEHGRWVGKRESFVSAGFLAASNVRKARAAADQGEVWGQVAAEQERLEAPRAPGARRRGGGNLVTEVERCVASGIDKHPIAAGGDVEWHRGMRIAGVHHRIGVHPQSLLQAALLKRLQLEAESIDQFLRSERNPNQIATRCRLAAHPNRTSVCLS